jgi:hypothetical protein
LDWKLSYIGNVHMEGRGVGRYKEEEVGVGDKKAQYIYNKE